ncbi:uncharacterized protein [Hetaerina americana]|uniref:uncharacterized protein n=1 Tax=Hetaerina americana TaxID=62018 RepID=UPI003A7F508E
MIQRETRHCHPLVEKLGHRTSFSPKDIPPPFIPKAKYYDETPLPPPRKLSFFEKLFHKEPKLEVVYPETNPRAKVMSFKEVCTSISNSLLTPPRFECAMRDPYLVFTAVPPPYFSHCPTGGSPPFQPCPSSSKTLAPLETCANAPGTPQSLKRRTCVSPSLERNAQLPPEPNFPYPEAMGRMSRIQPPPPVLPIMQSVKPVVSPPAMPVVAPPVMPVIAPSASPGAQPEMPPPPPKMVCGGTTPLDEMPSPFYSECQEPDCESQKEPEVCYEESTEKPCNVNRCKKKDFEGGDEELETQDGLPQPFYSKCPPKELKKFEEADD